MSQGAARFEMPRIFNTPLECGFRMLFLLHAAGPKARDLQRLISHDYLLIHSGDAVDGPPSLHPAVPHRGSEWLVKRDVISLGLNHMFSRGLISKIATGAGILYRGSELTAAFIRLLKAPYARLIMDRAHWVEDRFGDMGDEQLKVYMTDNVGRWGAEFERLTALRDLDLGLEAS
ncbi:ABC-three component system middle component 2 [Roseococcus sp.]|uniref:ABC-three component system middle component 2 n=1 Tax=Roseococcus sp. TaxID=2109646 RepID=UPI003BAB6AD7